VPVRDLGSDWLVAGLGLLLATACGTQDSPPKPGLTCVEGLRTDCSPLYDPPVYPTIFSKILHTTCATGQNTCHTRSASMGGLVFEDEQESYDLLLGTTDGRARVAPGDPACSILVERLEAKDPDLRMPPGPAPLSDAERCDFVQWIENGAAR